MKRVILVISMLMLFMMGFSTMPAKAAEKPNPPNPPVRVIPVTGNGLVDVAAGVINNFVMKDGSLVSIPSLNQRGLKVGLSKETNKTLPSTLPELNRLVDALSITVIKTGKTVQNLPGNNEIYVSFEQDPEWLGCDGDATLAIMRWNESTGWVEIAANTLDAYSDAPGVFALVKR